MAGRGREQSGFKSKETTPLLDNDLEIAYGATTIADPAEKKKPPQSLWEWAKAEAACYSKKLAEDWDRINRYGPNHVSTRWKEARSSRFV